MDYSPPLMTCASSNEARQQEASSSAESRSGNENLSFPLFPEADGFCSVTAAHKRGCKHEAVLFHTAPLSCCSYANEMLYFWDFVFKKLESNVRQEKINNNCTMCLHKYPVFQCMHVIVV